MSSIHDGPMVGFDTETTGVNVFDPMTRVVTCAMVWSPDAEIITPTEWMMDPGIEIPQGASDVHGITTERARAEGMDYREGLTVVANALQYTIESDIPLVAYNAAFDVSLLRNEFYRHQIGFPLELWDRATIIDPLTIDKDLNKFRRGKRTLEVVAGLHGYDLSNAHEATADVLATLHVARRILPALEQKYGMSFNKEDLMGFQKAAYAKQAADFQAYKRKTEPDAVINGEWPYKTVAE